MDTAQTSSHNEQAAPSGLCDPDRLVRDAATAIKGSLEHGLDTVKDYTRNEPERALISALAAGYVIRSLPLASVASSLFSVVFALAKPVAVVLAGAKVWQKLQNACKKPTDQRSQ